MAAGNEVPQYLILNTEAIKNGEQDLIWQGKPMTYIKDAVTDWWFVVTMRQKPIPICIIVFVLNER